MTVCMHVCITGWGPGVLAGLVSSVIFLSRCHMWIAGPGRYMWEKLPWSSKFGKQCVLPPLLEIPRADYSKTLRSPAVQKLI